MKDQNMDQKVGVGLVGSQFISSIHADVLSRVADAEVLEEIKVGSKIA